MSLKYSESNIFDLPYPVYLVYLSWEFTPGKITRKYELVKSTQAVMAEDDGGRVDLYYMANVVGGYRPNRPGMGQCLHVVKSRKVRANDELFLDILAAEWERAELQGVMGEKWQPKTRKVNSHVVADEVRT